MTKKKEGARAQLGSIRKCLIVECTKKETYIGRWKEHWHPYKDGYLCKNHYFKLIIYPKLTSEDYKKNNSKRTSEQKRAYNHKYYYRLTKEQIKERNHKRSQRTLKYKDKQRVVSKDPIRKGNCDWCNKNVGDEFRDSRGRLRKLKATLLHHLDYHDENPLKDTVELCSSCHTKEHEKLKKEEKIKALLVYLN